MIPTRSRKNKSRMFKKKLQFTLGLCICLGLGALIFNFIGDLEIGYADEEVTQERENFESLLEETQESIETSTNNSGNTSTEEPSFNLEDYRTDDEEVEPPQYTYEETVNLLFIGTNTGLTDTIMLSMFNQESQKIDIISIPRDTFYYRTGYTDYRPSSPYYKINAAYLGDASNTAKAVSEILGGIPIHYYAVIDFQGVENVINAMGGVAINVPIHMYYNDPYDEPPLHIDIPAGYQTLNGENAVKSLRFREGDEGYPSYPRMDLDRIEYQQEFIQIAFDKALGLNLPNVINTAYNNVKTNITIGDALDLGTSLIGMGSEDIEVHMLPVYSQEGPPYFQYPLVTEIKELIFGIYGYEYEDYAQPDPDLTGKA